MNSQTLADYGLSVVILAHCDRGANPLPPVIACRAVSLAAPRLNQWPEFSQLATVPTANIAVAT